MILNDKWVESSSWGFYPLTSKILSRYSRVGNSGNYSHNKKGCQKCLNSLQILEELMKLELMKLRCVYTYIKISVYIHTHQYACGVMHNHGLL